MLAGAKKAITHNKEPPSLLYVTAFLVPASMKQFADVVGGWLRLLLTALSSTDISKGADYQQALLYMTLQQKSHVEATDMLAHKLCQGSVLLTSTKQERPIVASGTCTGQVDC